MTEEAPAAKAPPALFDHCVNTYRTMLSEARSVITMAGGDDDEDDEDNPAHSIVVYEGFSTRLVTSQLNLSVPYYTQITQALINMGCVRQLKRGGGTSPSQWELIYEPTLEAFMNIRPKKNRKPSKDAMNLELIDGLNRRVSELEVGINIIQEALADLYGTTKVIEE